MGTLVRPATTARFGDVATVLGPKNPDATVCWYLSHRLDSTANRALTARHAASPKAADTRSVAGGFPRVLMRLNLH